MAQLVDPRPGVADSLRAAAAEPGWEEHPAYVDVSGLDEEAFQRLSALTWVQADQPIPLFQDSTQYVDVNLTYNINDQFAIYANGSNVFGERERYFYQLDEDSRQYASQNRFEPRYSAGVRVRF